VIFPDNQLYIMDYNRVVKDLKGNSVDEFLDKVEKKFDVNVISWKCCYANPSLSSQS